MTRLGCAGIAVLLLAWAVPAAAQAPLPRLVQQGDVTRFVAAPHGTEPTTAAGPGWTLDASDTVTSFPAAVDRKHAGAQVLSDSTKAAERGFPPVALGPRGELWLVANDAKSRAWADFLDAAESFYRHGGANITRVKPHGPAVIGRFGPCLVMSLPAESSLPVTRIRGAAAAGQVTETVMVRRFMRWLVKPEGHCTPAERDTLFLFGFAPRSSGIARPDSAGFFAVIPEVEWSRGVPRTMAEGWSSFIADDVDAAPRPEGFSLRVPERGATSTVQLCSSPEANEGCRRERNLRQRMYVLNPGAAWPADEAAIWNPFSALLSASCGELGIDRCGGMRDGWAKQAGPYLRTDFQAPLALARTPRVTSRVQGDTVIWEVAHANLESAAIGGQKVPLSVAGTQIEIEPLPRESWPILQAGIAILVLLVAGGATWFGLRRRGRVASPDKLRSMLLDDLGIGRAAEEGARTLHETLPSDRYDVLAFGWELVHPRIFGERETWWQKLVYRLPHWLPGASPRKLQPQPSTRRKAVGQLMKLAGSKGRTSVMAFNAFARDPGLAVCAGVALTRSPENTGNLTEVLFEVDPAWAQDRHLGRLAAMRDDPAALFCLGYELERRTGPTDRAAADSWAEVLPETSTHSLWDGVLNQVVQQEGADKLAWVRLGFALARQGGVDDHFDRRVQEMLARADRPRNDEASHSGSITGADLGRYDQVLLGMWLARTSRHRWNSPDTALAGVLLRLRSSGEVADPDAVVVVPPLWDSKDRKDVRTILLWLGHRLAAITSGEPVSAVLDSPPPQAHDQPRPDEPKQKTQIQLPGVPVNEEILLARLSSGVQEALSNGTGPEWAAPLATALREAMRNEAQAAVRSDTEERVAASATALESREKVEVAAQEVLDDLKKLRDELSEGVRQVGTLAEQQKSEIASATARLEALADRTIELAQWVQAQAQHTAATRAEVEAGFASAVEAHAARAAELWRSEAAAIVTPMVQEHVATQWEPYHEREQRLGPLIRNVQVMERVEGFLETLKQDEGFIDRVLALRQKIPTEAWLVLTDPTSPYRRLATEQPVQALIEPEYEKASEAIRRLPPPSRDAVRATLEAGSVLGYWIDAVWESLLDIDGRLNEQEGRTGRLTIRGRLSRRDTTAPLGEWSEAHKDALEFATYHANVYRRLLDRAFGGPRRALGEPRYVELVLLEETGLSRGDEDFATRLRQYLEPSAREGWLGRVIRAAQYLVEAFPREQLYPDELSSFREVLRQRLETAGLLADFHDVAARVAGGIGLEYRAVRYYHASIDAAGYEFIGREVTRISLTQRLGFDAQPSSDTLVVRVRRPFFFENNTFYAGHAHVARP